MGCVLPGAANPEQYWQNVVDGKSGIVNLADADPAAARDFLVGDGLERHLDAAGNLGLLAHQQHEPRAQRGVGRRVQR